MIMIVKITGQATQVMRWYYTEQPLRRELMQTELSQCLHVGMMINKDDEDIDVASVVREAA